VAGADESTPIASATASAFSVILVVVDIDRFSLVLAQPPDDSCFL
jgi:hypothetical protein